MTEQKNPVETFFRNRFETFKSLSEEMGEEKALKKMFEGYAEKVKKRMAPYIENATLAKDPPDLVLLDIMMPRMSGFEVCRQIKSNPKTRDILVVMVTALNETGDIERATECGADDYLSKPIDRKALVNLVRTLLSGRAVN